MPIDEALENIESSKVKINPIDLKNTQINLPENIRSDIKEIISKSDKDFEEWYSFRKEATLRLLRDYEPFASIPNLNYKDSGLHMGAQTHVKMHIESLKTGLKYLEDILKIRNKYRSM